MAYVLPGAEHWVLGSTYEQTPWPPATATEHNITSNQRFLGDGPIEPVRYQRAARCVSSDRDPVIGKVDEHTWVSAAHGSMGSSSAPLRQALLSAMCSVGFRPRRHVPSQRRSRSLY